MELTTVHHTSLREDVSSAQDWCHFVPASYGFCNIVLSLVGGWLAVKTSPEPRYTDILGFWAGFHGYRRGPGEQVLRQTLPCIAVYILVSGHRDVGMEKGFEFGENKATEYLTACFLAQVICFVASNERRQVLKRTSPCSFVPRNPSWARRETFPPYERVRRVYKSWNTSHLSKALFARANKPATKANENNYLHDFTVALQTDNNTWTSV